MNCAKIIAMDWILKMQTCDGKQDFAEKRRVSFIVFFFGDRTVLQSNMSERNQIFFDFCPKKLTKLKKEIPALNFMFFLKKFWEKFRNNSYF